MNCTARLAASALGLTLLLGCGSWAAASLAGVAPPGQGGPSAGATPSWPDGKPLPFDVLTPEATGALTTRRGEITIDYSNTRDGYVMVRHSGGGETPAKVLVLDPNGAESTYAMTSAEYEAFPLTGGDGRYAVGVYEQARDGRYYLRADMTADVALASEFSPFLRPNQVVDYDGDSEVVRLAAAVTGDAGTIPQKIADVYHYVISEFRYDTEMAATVRNDYLPDIDAALERKSGICFDYTAIMAAMLRCQGIPTKLVVGYTGEAYHAWLSVYSQESGWIDGAVYFDGKSWTLMDPTFAASGARGDALARYIGDGTRYEPVRLY